MTRQPAYPMQEVITVPPVPYRSDMDPNQPLYTLQLDYANRWWLFEGTEPAIEIDARDAILAMVSSLRWPRNAYFNRGKIR